MKLQSVCTYCGVRCDIVADVENNKIIKIDTLFISFHFAKSKTNFLFGDESDSFTKTANFKSLKAKVE